MRAISKCLLLGAAIVPLVAIAGGCSSVGAPIGGAEFGELQAAADDHVSALLLVKRWFAILHNLDPDNTSARCDAKWVQVPSLPGDPPGSTRHEGLMSDCTVIDALLAKDGSGEQVFRRPDGKEKSMVWGPKRTEGTWTKYDIEEQLWNGTRLFYETGFDTGSVVNDQYEKGRTVLPDGREMDFEHLRSLKRDLLRLDSDDGVEMEVSVPLRVVTGSQYWPAFTAGASGTYESAAGRHHDLELTGEDRWETWEMTLEDGSIGRFSLDDDLGGSGRLRKDQQLLALLRWQPTGDGVLDPLSAPAANVSPAAAARDFQVDRWIGNVVAMGPMPLY